MPKWVARDWIEITGVRPEPLQEISEQDAIAEGMEEIGETRVAGRLRMEWKSYIEGATCLSAVAAYSTKWESIHGPGSWEANLYVWVYEFQRIEK